MKVYSVSAEVQFDYDYADFTQEDFAAKSQAYIAKVKDLLIVRGYTGENTGRIARFPVADGAAEYMFADDGRHGALIHLETCDCYQYRGIEHMSKAGILEEIEMEERRAAMVPMFRGPTSDPSP